MEFDSNIDNVLKAYKESRKQALQNIGTYVTAEAQTRAPVGTAPSDNHKGNMRRSITFTVIDDNEVDIGCTADAPYAPFVEKGTSKQKAQPFIEPAVMDNLDRLQE